MPSRGPRGWPQGMDSSGEGPRWVAQGSGTRVEWLPLVCAPVVHTGVEGDALLLTEAPPVRRTLLGRKRQGGRLREELGPTKAFLSRLSRKWLQPARPCQGRGPRGGLSSLLSGRRAGAPGLQTHVCWPSRCCGLDPIAPHHPGRLPRCPWRCGDTSLACAHPASWGRAICVSATTATGPGTRALTERA